jgi:5-methylcytosine-specific restriction endonuclease McrA
MHSQNLKPRDRTQEQRAQYRQSRVSAGWCSSCLVFRPIEGRKTCQRCAEARKAYQTARRSNPDAVARPQRPKLRSESFKLVGGKKVCRTCGVIEGDKPFRRGWSCRACERERDRKYKKPKRSKSLALKIERITKARVGQYLAKRLATREERYVSASVGRSVLAILAKQAGRCAICTIPLDESMEIDHIVPIAKGGSSDKENLQWLCPDCNSFKSDKNPADFVKLVELGSQPMSD